MLPCGGMGRASESRLETALASGPDGFAADSPIVGFDLVNHHDRCRRVLAQDID